MANRLNNLLSGIGTSVENLIKGAGSPIESLLSKPVDPKILTNSRRMLVEYGDRFNEDYAVVIKPAEIKKSTDLLKENSGVYVIRSVYENNKMYYLLLGPFSVLYANDKQAKSLGLNRETVYINSAFAPYRKGVLDVGVLSDNVIASVPKKISGFYSNYLSPDVKYNRLTKYVPTSSRYAVYDDFGWGYGTVPKKLVDNIERSHNFPRIVNEGDHVPVILYNASGEPISSFRAVVSADGSKIQIPEKAVGDLGEFKHIEIIVGLNSSVARQLV